MSPLEGPTKTSKIEDNKKYKKSSKVNGEEAKENKKSWIGKRISPVSIAYSFVVPRSTL